MLGARKARVLRHVREHLRPLGPDDLAAEVRLVVQIEAHSEEIPEVVEAAAVHDHQAVSLDDLEGAAVVGDDPLQLGEYRLERLLEAERLAEHLRDRDQRLGAQARRLELFDAALELGQPAACLGQLRGAIGVHPASISGAESFV
jgi:hypothetical protein